MGTRNGAEWGRVGGRVDRSKNIFEVVAAEGCYRVRNKVTREFVALEIRFADACERAYELEREARQRRRIFPW
jgi:hypothetical protein